MKKIAKMMADNVTFGVELETTIPVGAPVNVGGYHHGTPVTAGPAFNGQHWRAERDGSIQAGPGHRACEFVSPILQGPAGVENLVAMIRWIKSIGGKVNVSCGCHVHVGVASVIGAPATAAAGYVKKLAHIVNINTESLYAQTGTRRDQSHYTRRLDRDIRETLAVAARSGQTCFAGDHRVDRYRVLNVTNVASRGTVEFRAFAGTLNEAKVLHHVWTCLFLACFARELAAPRWAGANWQAVGGAKAVRCLHRKMRNHCLVGEMANRAREMRAVALRMAAKYDGRVAVA